MDTKKVDAARTHIIDLARGTHTDVEKTSHGMLLFGAGIMTIFITSLEFLGDLMGARYCWFTFILLSSVIALGFASKVVEYFEKLLRNIADTQAKLQEIAKREEISQEDLVEAQKSILKEAWKVELWNTRLILGPEDKRKAGDLKERSFHFFIFQFRAILFQIVLLCIWFVVTFALVLFNLTAPLEAL